MNISQFIDHTLLRPTATDSDIQKLCEEAIENEFKTVCVSPIAVDLASKILEKSDVAVGTVIGFPFGYDDLSTKIYGTQKAMDHGAKEIDAVITISAVKNANWQYIENEIETLATIINKRSDKILKIIFETAYLDFDEIKELCNLCVKYNVDFVKTSTGYADAGADKKIVSFMNEIIQNKIGIKASGGIRTRAFADELIAAGATRLGTSRGIDILRG